jgi:ADP-heptose:LPS heptosyltransferase
MPPDPLAHRVRFYLAVIEGMGINTNRPEFFSAVTSESPPESGTLLLCPDSDFGPSHEWPLERWQELAGRLAAEGWRLTVAGIPGGRNLGRLLAGHTEVSSRFFEAVDFAATLPLLSAHTVTVAADGSLVHLAAHAGSTCVALFGPNDPAWKRPLGRRHRVARRHVECAPCLAAKCPLDRRCQEELTVDRVLGALQEVSPTASALIR